MKIVLSQEEANSYLKKLFNQKIKGLGGSPEDFEFEILPDPPFVPDDARAVLKFFNEIEITGRCLNINDKISAIKLLRNNYGLTLLDAKNHVEEIIKDHNIKI